MSKGTWQRFGDLLMSAAAVAIVVIVLVAADVRLDEQTLVTRAVRANVRASVDHLRHGSEILEQAIAGDGRMVVGAEYSLETGVVDFFEAGLFHERLRSGSQIR